jgi:hypothetical protein
VPVIIGTVRNETLSFLLGALTSPINSVEYEAIVLALFESYTWQVLSLYPPVDGDCRDVLVQVTKLKKMSLKKIVDDRLRIRMSFSARRSFFCQVSSPDTRLSLFIPAANRSNE